MSNNIKNAKPEEVDFQERALDSMCVNESHLQHPWWYNFKYTAVGILFGIVFVKAEIISWFRIQEMFRLQSFHMYGVIGTAVIVGTLVSAIFGTWVYGYFRDKLPH